MSSFKTIGWLFKLILKLADIRVLYEQIKANPESKKVSTVLGKKALLYNISFIILGTLSIMGTIYFGKTVGTLAFLIGIIGIIVSISTLVVSLQLLVLALSCTIKQLALNRKFIGWFNLILLIGTVIVLCIVVSLLLNALDASIAADATNSGPKK